VHRATGVFNGGPKRNLTQQVTWSWSNTSVVVISNAQGSKGMNATLTVQ